MDLRKLVGDPGEEPYVFRRCDFTEANLRGVNLRAAKFEDCRLARADLTGAFLDETTWVGGSAPFLVLVDAEAEDAVFRGIDLANSRGEAR
ncbi:hypothetical protein C3Y87_03080 [Carbonactinospora thermoautotrophica]|uniref:pentapeptide repeat-containing protein n=1 Tax=Carbonactinospora thermoautotrophica TaxID=1469144 RepID=UPI00226F0E7F|nr:pentapeptide repeat-containing protein [Carbonactinospora thermoautotrophica]MCX9190416.1 hypothetical protein [Carbonactinospora thermoautotrophica]